ncbi:MAG: PorV/PorQ family protein [Elusimicrobia bacterium]|nr:PorV/PorQ family protein [Elusimicrobiota bacterium]
MRLKLLKIFAAKIFTTFYFLLFLFAIAPVCRSAEKADGGLPGYFLNLGFGARALGMGGAHTAVAGDAGAVYWNPAGLSMVGAKTLQLMHVTLFEDTYYDTLAYAHPLGYNTTIGLGIARLYSGGFTQRDDNNFPIGSFSDENTAAILGLASRFGNEISIGLSPKIIRKNFAGLSATAFGLDAGMMARPFSQIYPEFTFGLAVRNIVSPKIQRANLTDAWPFSTRVGVALPYNHNSGKEFGILLAADAEKKQNQDAKYYFGLELTFYQDVLAVRGGYEPQGATAGLGYTLRKNQPYELCINYAILKHPTLGLTHRLSLDLSFGGWMPRWLP